MKHLRYLFFFLSVSFSFGQVSHATLVKDLLGDLKEALAESNQLEIERLEFQGDETTCSYLNELAKSDSVGSELVVLNLEHVDLSINKNPDYNGRNSAYLRKLKLSVNYEFNGNKREWSGGITDRLTESQLKQLLDEAFPVEISGNYLEDQPSGLRVSILSILSLSVVAALYFIRT